MDGRAIKQVAIADDELGLELLDQLDQRLVADAFFAWEKVRIAEHDHIAADVGDCSDLIGWHRQCWRIGVDALIS